MKCVHREEPFGCTVHCYEPFGCTYECRHAQQNVPHSPYDFSDYYPCREMTAADLGLPALNYCAKHDNLYATVCHPCELKPGERLANWGDIVMDGEP